MGEAVSVTLEQKLLVASTVASARDRGVVIAAFAASLARSRRTIRRWAHQFRNGVLGTNKPGPDATAVPRSIRQGICVVLAALGAAADEQLLRRLFSEATFSVIRGMKKRFRRVCSRRTRRGKSRLHWQGPGRAWAMDFTQPKAEIEGGHTHLLMIRDLASGCRLASVACTGEKASTVVKTLELLFAAFGAPLVIKHDGGPGFIAQRTQTFLEEHDVFSMRSPARTPEYNGSIERSLGWDKERIERVAELAGHGGYWTLEDIERARLQANATLFPRGLRGKTPEEVFAARVLITAKERAAFKRTVDELTTAELKKHQDDSGIITARAPFETLERRAITRALVKHGYLNIRRGRISTPFPTPQPDRNS